VPINCKNFTNLDSTNVYLISNLRTERFVGVGRNGVSCWPWGLVPLYGAHEFW